MRRRRRAREGGSGELVSKAEAERSRRHISSGRSFQRPWEEFPYWEQILSTVRDEFAQRAREADGQVDHLREPEAYFGLINSAVLQAHPEWGIEPTSIGRLSQLLRAYQFGYGPLEDYMHLDGLEEVYFNDYDEGFYVIGGVKHSIPDEIFKSTAELVEFVRRVANENDLEINLKRPNLDATLKDGSRLNATLQPIAVGGPDLVIRKHRDIPFTIPQLIESGTLTAELAEDIRRWIVSGLNIVVSGGTSSGKTSLLNTIGNAFIPADDRVLILENTTELQIKTEDTKYFRTIEDATREGGEDDVTMKDLIRFTLRKRPDRIIVGEVRGSEAYYALAAWNSGHEGSMCTVHANSASAAINKLVMLARGAGELDESSIRFTVSDAVDLVIQVDRIKGGAQRRIREVIQVLHENKYDRLNDGVIERIKQLTAEKKLRRLDADTLILQLYRSNRDGQLVKLSDALPLDGRG